MQLNIGDYSCDIDEFTVSYGSSYNGKKMIYHRVGITSNIMSQSEFIEFEKKIVSNFTGSITIVNEVSTDTYNGLSDPAIIKRYDSNSIVISIDFTKPME